MERLWWEMMIRIWIPRAQCWLTRGRPVLRSLCGGDSSGDDELLRLRSLVARYRKVFAMSSTELGCTSVLHHRIETNGRGPIFQAARRLPWASRESARQLVEDMKAQAVVEDSCSPWSSPIVLVQKKERVL